MEFPTVHMEVLLKVTMFSTCFPGLVLCETSPHCLLVTHLPWLLLRSQSAHDYFTSFHVYLVLCVVELSTLIVEYRPIHFINNNVHLCFTVNASLKKTAQSRQDLRADLRTIVCEDRVYFLGYHYPRLSCYFFSRLMNRWQFSLRIILSAWVLFWGFFFLGGGCDFKHWTEELSLIWWKYFPVLR